MDVMLHKRCAKFIYVVPEGLRELMSDISREVIRSQPDHMYTFIADYLDAMMITRENARVAARLVDSILRIATMTVGLLEQTGMSRDDADRMATIIQDAFKRYMAVKPEAIMFESREEEEEEEHEMILSILQTFGDACDQENAAAVIIQRAFREFKDRHSREKQLLTGMIDWRVAARSAIYLYRRTGVTIEEANRAATLIKAAYKGYYTRRIMKRLLEEGRLIYEERGEDMVPTEDEAEGDGELEELPAFKQFRDVEGDLPDYDLMSTKEIPKVGGAVDVAESVLGSVLKSVVPDSVHKVVPTTASTAGTAGPTTGITTGTGTIQPDTPPPTEATEPQSEVTKYDATQEDVIPEIPHDYPEAEGEFASTTADITEGLPTESGEAPQSMPGEAQQSMPGEVQQSMPGEAQQQSMPGEAQQSMPGEVQQSMPGEAQQTMPGEAQQAMPVEAPASDVGDTVTEPATDATMEGITEPFTEETTEPPTDGEMGGA